VLILIVSRFCHKTIIAAATDMLQVSESERFPARATKLNKIVTGWRDPLPFYARLTSRRSHFRGFLAAC
jgi:hypothetical protein